MDDKMKEFFYTTMYKLGVLKMDIEAKQTVVEGGSDLTMVLIAVPRWFWQRRKVVGG